MKTMVKKFIAYLCAISMILSVVIVAQAAGVSIVVGGRTVVQANGEESIQIPIDLSGNTGIAGMTLQISYTEGLTLTEITKGAGLTSLTMTKPGDLTANPFNLIWDGQDADTSNGTVATLVFTVPKNTVKEYEINVSTDGVFDNGLNDVVANTTNGKISVTEKPKEDMQGVSLTGATYTYDGTAKSLEVKGAPAGASVNYENNGMTDAGTYNVKATVAAPGYNDKVLNATLKITPKALNVTGLSAANKEYDGTKTATISGGALSGVVSGDDVSATFPISGTFAKKDVGTGISVSFANIALSGTKKANYTLTQPSLKANITATPITVTADSHSIMIGDEIPELTYKVTSGKLAEGDSFSGKLSTKVNASKEGTYDILQGTLKLSSNYKLTFAKGTITVSDKTAQNIVVSEITNKVYGDDSFVVTATADETAKLSNFTYESSNTDVAEIAADGTVTIVGAGETEITVKEPGNDTYAPFENTQTLVVSEKEVVVEAIDLDAKTATLVGVLDADKETVELDFDKIAIELIEGEDVSEVVSEELPEGEGATELAVKVTNFVLKGDKAINYNVTTEELETTVSEDAVATVSVNATNGTVTGEGVYLIGSEVTLIAEADEGYKFSGWYVGEESVLTDAEYTFVIETDVEFVAKFTKKATGGSGGGGMQASGDMSRPKDEVKPEVKPEVPETTTPEVTPSASAGFEDLGGYDWAKDAVKTLTESGIIKGTSENTFAPGKNITRADYVALIVRLFNLTSDSAENFSDVSSSDYFADELAAARNNGIVGGVGDNKFAPRGSITRQDMMVMLYRAMTKMNIELTADAVSATDFSEVADYAKEAVSALVSNGIINGKNGKIDPKANTTRAEVAVMLSRVLDYVK